MKIKCYAFVNDEELEAPFLEYLQQKYTPPENESDKDRERRVSKIISVREHISHVAERKGVYYIPPLVKTYKCRKIGNINEIGILKIKEGNILIRIGFVTFGNKQEIIIFDAFDKPSLYEKAKKREVEKAEQKFVENIEDYITDYLKNGYSLPLPNWEGL